MSFPVTTIPENMPLREAARLLSRERVSGAPVVDAVGRCVGVLSATDFIRWAEKGGQADKIHCTRPAEFHSEWQVIDLEFLPNDEVRWHMTADPVTVAPDTPMAQLARMMLDAHIHRLVVVDAKRHPIGIVTSTDILAAVAGAEAEAGCAHAFQS
jgi:CBS domain-containing protein